MRRDMDLIRLLLLKFEEETGGRRKNLKNYKIESNLDIDGYTADQVHYHINLMHEGGLIKADKVVASIIVHGLSIQGHDLVDSVRDEEIWRNTKDGAKKVGGVSLRMIGELAEGFIKTQIKNKTGIDI